MHGFDLVREQEISEIKALGRLYKHAKTGAELLSVSLDDENKVFGIAFRTPPKDSTGVAHILEHSVLCGSKKYPVKEPFVELLKSSLQTFLNAFTYPDKTCYPVASTNLKDFYNLIDVYMDAVFHPVISENIFKQEGRHYELESLDAPLTMKGVVYNEMKGAYSSPDGVLSEFSQRELFPDITYGIDSGGDPEVIPELTYEQFKAFHDEYYHPSNARILFYGDDDEEARLKKAAEYLDQFEAITIDSSVGVQKPFAAPKRVEKSYMAAKDAGSMFTVNWLLPETLDREAVLAFEMLEHLLTGLPSSPLRLVLMESGYGEDLAGVGLEDELRQMYFSIGMKGVKAKNVDKAAKLISEVLQKIADEGPHPQAVEAAVNCVEFDLRENNTGRFPRGLSLWLRSLTGWLYGGDPLEAAGFEAPLAAVKAKLDSGVPLFQDMIREHFLENPHSVTLVLHPDPNLAEEREKKEIKRLADDKAAMSEEQLKQVMVEAEELERMQATPDDPEAVAAIPTLKVGDLEREEKSLPEETKQLGDVPVHQHDLPADGIVYLDLGFDLSGIPDDKLPLVPVLGKALVEMGTRKDGFFGLSMRIAGNTGGIDASPYSAAVLGDGGPVQKLFLRGKAVASHAPELMDIMGDVLLDADFSDKERFRRLVLEDKARMEQRLIPAGHMVVAGRLRASVGGSAGVLSESMGGMTTLFALRKLVDAVDKNWDKVLADLEELRQHIVNSKGLIVNVTADGESLQQSESHLQGLLGRLPAAPLSAVERSALDLPEREGLVVPAQVNYAGKACNIFDAGYTYHGSSLAAVRHARMAWLWDMIRVRGGAYGAFCILDRFSGALSFVSYRDPNLDNTLKIFDDTAEYFRTTKFSKAEVEKSIIGAMGDWDSYMLPDDKGFAALSRQMTGDDPAVRKQVREELLSTTADDFHALGEAMAKAMQNARICVMGSEQKLKASAAGLKLTSVL
jgi:hypothetical protein